MDILRAWVDKETGKERAKISKQIYLQQKSMESKIKL